MSKRVHVKVSADGAPTSSRRRNAVVALGGMLCAPLFSRLSIAAPKPEEGVFRISMQPWIGYALWYVAQAKGIFAKNGLDKVEFVNFTEDADNLAILASGAIQGTSTAFQGVLRQAQQDDGLRVVMLEDRSMTADCILAPAAIKSVAQLQGKWVAFEFGSTSHLLMADALEKAGLKLSSIKSVNIPAAQAAGALIAGRVDAAVSYEPYVSAALQARPDIRRLYSAELSPGLIGDCFVVTGKALATRPGQVIAMIKSWGDAQQEYQRNPEACQDIMAKGIGADSKNLSPAFSGIHYYSLAETRSALAYFTTLVLPRINRLCIELGLVDKRLDTNKIVDSKFVGAA
jgi:NitT/TauT family transport system substrate-binding protein